MKKTVCLLFLVCMGASLFAQTEVTVEKEETETLAGRDFRVSGFGGPTMNFAFLGGNFGFLMGGGGGVLINNALVLGGGGSGLTTDYPASPMVKPDQSVDFGYGGFLLGYIIRGRKLIHPAIFLNTGWGAVTLTHETFSEQSDPVFVLIPSAQLELNITKFFKIGLGGGYIKTFGVDNWLYTDNDFSGTTIQMSMCFGWFD